MKYAVLKTSAPGTATCEDYNDFREMLINCVQFELGIHENSNGPPFGRLLMTAGNGDVLIHADGAVRFHGTIKE